VHHLVSTTTEAPGRRRGSGRHAQEAQCTPAKSINMNAPPTYPRENEASVLASLLDKEATRFTDVTALTGLKATQVNRALKALVSQHLVLAQTIPGQDYPIKVRYTLSKRGEAVARAVEAFKRELAAAQKTLGLADSTDSPTRRGQRAAH
jgi:DNA-binding HxlR family transcriptional regulator